MSPEERALTLSNTLLDRGMVPIVSTECRALIAAAIREAEREALKRAIAATDAAYGASAPSDDAGFYESVVKAIRSLIHTDKPKDTGE